MVFVFKPSLPYKQPAGLVNSLLPQPIDGLPNGAIDVLRTVSADVCISFEYLGK